MYEKVCSSEKYAHDASARQRRMVNSIDSQALKMVDSVTPDKCLSWPGLEDKMLAFHAGTLHSILSFLLEEQLTYLDDIRIGV